MFAAYLAYDSGDIDPDYSPDDPYEAKMQKMILRLLKGYDPTNDEITFRTGIEVWKDPAGEHAFIPLGTPIQLVAPRRYKFCVGYDKNGKKYKKSRMV